MGDELPRDTLPDFRDVLPTVAGIGDELRMTPPTSKCPTSVMVEIANPGRPRPVTLVDGVDDELATVYRREAAQILASGIYPVGRATDSTVCEEGAAVAGRRVG